MGGEREEDHHPVTPAGRFFLQPEIQQIIHCAIGLKFPIDIDSIRKEVMNTFVKHPRFCCILVTDEQGRNHWKRTVVDIKEHVFVPILSESTVDDNEFINGYLSDLAVSSPLDFCKPLWEIHLLEKQRCCVLRVHHALGDGISLVSLFLSCFRRVDDPSQSPKLAGDYLGRSNRSKSPKSLLRRIWEWMVMLWFSLIFILQVIFRILCVSDPITSISGGAGVELWPRKSATARFSLHDMKIVKNAVHATINDVLLGVVSLGLARYLQVQKHKTQKLQMTGVAMVNTRRQPCLQDISYLMSNNSSSKWGNQFGFILLPFNLHKDGVDPLEYVRKAKAMLDQKKKSIEAHFTYKSGALLMSMFGIKVPTIFNYRMMCNTTFTISNVVGPREEVMFAGNPITYLHVSSTSLPHALTMHIISYMDKLDMQILVAKDLIPDPQFLAKCFQDSLLEMRDMVLSRTS